MTDLFKTFNSKGLEATTAQSSSNGDIGEEEKETE